ncbi:MAG: hypothetical protein U9Q63_04500 [Patescibacteria group bacterium]|nr:hypothetical protein [Patescibacteria group bacterium]
MWKQLIDDKKVRYGIVIVLIVLFGWMIVRGRGQDRDQVMPEITLEPTKQIVTELQLPMSEVEKQAVENKFLSEGVEMTLLKDISGGQAVGTAWRHFDGEEFSFKVEVSELTKVEKGFYYEVWMVGKDGFFSVGRVGDMTGFGKLYFTDKEDKSEFRGVVVTLEQEDGDETPDKHILEGSF